MTPSEVLAAVKARLSGLLALDHPVRDWPRECGLPLPGVAVQVLPSVSGYRMAGRSSLGVERVRLHCVGWTPIEALEVAAEARLLMDGFRVTATAGTAREDSYGVEPALNADADPQRYEIPIQYVLPI